MNEDGGPVAADPLARRLAALSPQRRAALESLLHARTATPAARPPALRPRPPGARVPLSFGQQRLWWLDQLTPGNPAYNETNSLRLAFPVDVGALRRAVDEIVRRHEALRTTVEVVDGEPYQRVLEALSLEIPLIDLERLPADEREPEALRLAAEQSQAPFDLARGPLLRASVLRLGPSDHLLALTMHHMVCDGWSMGVFMVELVTLYWSYATGKPSPLPGLPVQYGDYALWQRERLTPAAMRGQLAYWRTQLSDLSTVDLPADRPRPAVFSFAGARCPVVIGEPAYRSLSAIAEREGVTLFMLLLAGFAALLHRYTEQPDIVVGTPTAGRDRRELERLIGFFVNTLVMRVRVADDATFLDLLGEVRRTATAAYANADVPFDRIVDEVQPQRDRSRNPLYQVAFQLFTRPSATGLREDLLLPFESVDSGIAKTDLSLQLLWTGSDVRGHVEYSTDLFDRPRIERMVAHYLQLLADVAADPGKRVADLAVLTPPERDRLLVDWQRTEVPYPRERTIPELFAEQVERTPDAIALRYAERTMTYRELHGAAAAVTGALQAQGVRRGDLVGLHVERGFELPAAVLGILGAGAAYVPLDRAYPAERIAFLLSDSGARAVITAEPASADLQGHHGAVIELHEAIGRTPDAAPAGPAGGAATDVAYVMYTSGTTGRPKGVAVTHRNVVRLVTNVSYVDLAGGPVVLQFAPISFDASTFELWGCLLNGGTLAIHPPEVPSLEELGAFIRREQVSVLFLTTALFNQMVERCPGDLRGVGQLLTGGEQMFVPAAKAAWTALPRSRVLNMYGPTECTTYATGHVIRRQDALADAVPIGRPIDNTTAYVLDRNGHPMPVGVPGELCLGGDGVAAGYWERLELTDERFVRNPFGSGRLYRTGDVACFREDGEILFLGRRDRQVKVSGHRVELGEVEAAMCAHSGVRAAAVVATEEEPRRLLAYYAAHGEQPVAADALRAYLLERLPRYMVPLQLEPVDEIPLTPNGKVDAGRLAGIGRRTGGSDGHVAPRTPVEEKLAAMWRELLDVERVGVRDNFFELGGHSLVATRLLSRIRAAYGAEVPMSSFFDGPTVEDLARLVR